MEQLLSQRMAIYALIIKNSFRQRFAYRSEVWLIMLNAFAVVILQGGLWTALIHSGYVQVTLQQMISFIIINSVVSYFTYFEAASIIGDRVRDGSIILDFTMPVNFKWKTFSESMGENLFDIIFYSMITCLTAFLFYGAAAPASITHFLIFIPSIVLGVLISYHIIYILGLSAFWIVSPYYITFLVGGLTKLFGGGVVPIWFYPDWLVAVCNLLPFRYITFEPIEIYLGYSDIVGATKCVLVQGAWIAILIMLEKLIWAKASKKVFIQGG